ncbi:Lrp/AsnC family transcriptional regulator [Rhizohabitans arisaemae]|uniref:Lrp/AsnC family transcriptional regulator n=1 Tax=Rhizohabitans arisaemae TaxID=2720610 RepID=UPI0024B1660C|nr:Lrp/AsnC family transcriptional regulator [Rhizohabitans arisaemae]
MSTDDLPLRGPAGQSVAHLDETDKAIIAELLRDGRLSVRAIAERVHVSRANAYARINRMTSDGTITGFTARLDPQRVGLTASAYVMLSIEQNTWRTVAQHLRKIPYVDHIALVGGDFDVLVLVRTPDNAALRHVVLERFHEIPGVRGTRTSLVFEETAGRGMG